MKVMTIPKLELQAALLAAWFQEDICRALAVHVNNVLCGPIALMASSGFTPEAISQYLLQTVYARF